MVQVNGFVNHFGKLTSWLGGKGFRVVDFLGKNKLLISTYHLGQTLVFQLAPNEGYTTFIKEGSGGSLIVFEVKAVEGELRYQGYCPILLFGLWPKKLTFKRDAKLLSFRAEGYMLELELNRWMEKNLGKNPDISS